MTPDLVFSQGFNWAARHMQRLGIQLANSVVIA